MIFVPLSNIPVAALIEPVTAKLPVVPLSVRVRRVLGETSASLIVKTPLVPAVARVKTGLPFDNVIGVADENVLEFEKIFAWSRYATFESVPPTLISTPPSWIAVVAFKTSPATVPEAVISVAPVIAPALVMPPP